MWKRWISILPIELNFTVTKDALEAGKHVIVEKPIAANLHEAKLMLGFSGKYKQVMMVAENYRSIRSSRESSK